MPAMIDRTGSQPTPSCAISLRPKIATRMAARDRAALGMSIRPAWGSRYSGSSLGPSTRRTTMTGTASRNTAPHQKNSSTSPPRSGPIAPPTEKLVIQMAMAFLRCVGSRNMLRIRDRVDGASVAPARPSNARAPMSMAGVVENAASTEVAPNAAAPIISSRRRPIRSPSVPIVISEPATMNP